MNAVSAGPSLEEGKIEQFGALRKRTKEVIGRMKALIAKLTRPGVKPNTSKWIKKTSARVKELTESARTICVNHILSILNELSGEDISLKKEIDSVFDFLHEQQNFWQGDTSLQNLKNMVKRIGEDKAFLFDDKNENPDFRIQPKFQKELMNAWREYMRDVHVSVRDAKNKLQRILKKLEKQFDTPGDEVEWNKSWGDEKKIVKIGRGKFQEIQALAVRLEQRYVDKNTLQEKNEILENALQNPTGVMQDTVGKSEQ